MMRQYLVDLKQKCFFTLISPQHFVYIFIKEFFITNINILLGE